MCGAGQHLARAHRGGATREVTAAGSRTRAPAFQAAVAVLCHAVDVRAVERGGRGRCAGTWSSSVIWRRIHTYYVVIKHVLRVEYHVIRAHDTLRAI